MKNLSHSMHVFLQERHCFIHLHMDGSFSASPPDCCSKPTFLITLIKIATPPPPYLGILSTLFPRAHNTAHSILLICPNPRIWSKDRCFPHTCPRPRPPHPSSWPADCSASVCLHPRLMYRCVGWGWGEKVPLARMR